MNKSKVNFRIQYQRALKKQDWANIVNNAGYYR